MNDNHVYAVLPSPTGTIRIDIMSDPEDTSRKGMLAWENLPYMLLDSAVRYQDFQFTRKVTVKELYMHIRDLGLHRYQFSGGGSGCHFWV